MKKHLNTLFVTTQGAYLAKEGETVAVRVEKQVKGRFPIHMLGGLSALAMWAVAPFSSASAVSGTWQSAS